MPCIHKTIHFQLINKIIKNEFKLVSYSIKIKKEGKKENKSLNLQIKSTEWLNGYVYALFRRIKWNNNIKNHVFIDFCHKQFKLSAQTIIINDHSRSQRVHIHISISFCSSVFQFFYSFIYIHTNTMIFSICHSIRSVNYFYLYFAYL